MDILPDVLEASPSVVEDALMPLGLNQDGGIIPLHVSPQAIIEIDQLRWRFGHRSKASRLLLDPSPGSLESSRARRLDARAPGGQR